MSGYRIIDSDPMQLPGRLFGPVGYYAMLSRYPAAAIDGNILFDKRRKEWHRYTIADRSGVAQLTVPIIKPHGINRATWSDVGVSSHGQWWHVHRQTLETAYGRSPFFEFYIDRLAPFFSADTPDRYPRLIDLLRATDAVIRDILLIPQAPDCEVSARLTPAAMVPNVADNRNGFDINHQQPYFQPRQEQLGFIANLSVLDLIFNLGNEAPLYLNAIEI